MVVILMKLKIKICCLYDKQVDARHVIYQQQKLFAVSYSY